MIRSMRARRLDRRVRVATILVALALFVGGSNYCLLAALAGTPMACFAPPGATPAAGSHCSHHSGGHRGTAPAASPCCVNLAPVAAVHVAKADATHVPTVANPTSDPPTPAAPAVARHEGIADESPPPTFGFPATRLGRAPPLS